MASLEHTVILKKLFCVALPVMCDFFYSMVQIFLYGNNRILMYGANFMKDSKTLFYIMHQRIFKRY